MKHALLLALTLSMPALSHAAEPSAPDDTLEAVKTALARDWVVDYAGSPDTVEVRSPIYVMPFGGACVIHRLTFLPDLTGRPNMASMVTTTEYYAWASGDACKGVDPRQFYAFEPGSDVISLLDIARRAQAGPKAGVDTVAKAERERIAACFTPEAMRTTRVVRGFSRFDRDMMKNRYVVILQCNALADGEELHVLRDGEGDALSWDVRSLGAMVPAG